MGGLIVSKKDLAVLDGAQIDYTFWEEECGEAGPFEIVFETSAELEKARKLLRK